MDPLDVLTVVRRFVGVDASVVTVASSYIVVAVEDEDEVEEEVDASVVATQTLELRPRPSMASSPYAPPEACAVEGGWGTNR